LAQGDFGGGPSFREFEPLAHGLPLNGPAVHMESSMAATGSSDGEAGMQWAALAGVTAALAMFGAAQGLSYPLFTLLMQRQGMSPALIGLSAAMMPVGLILSARSATASTPWRWSNSAAASRERCWSPATPPSP
jgi:hypothetical protein